MIYSRRQMLGAGLSAGFLATAAQGQTLAQIVAGLRSSNQARFQQAKELADMLRTQRLGALDASFIREQLKDADPQIRIQAIRASESMPGSRLVSFPNAGHFPHRDNPRRFNRALLDFMEDTDPSVIPEERYLRATKFWGKLFLINFAMGVVTGIVQEFQFGMNWSDYSRFVGDIFGAPLAIEGLLAFFLESTFLGLWIFGWDRLPGGCTWPASGWCTSARSSRRTSSSPPTPGCRTRSASPTTPRPAAPSWTSTPMCCWCS